MALVLPNVREPRPLPRVMVDPIMLDYQQAMFELAARDGYKTTVDDDMFGFAAFLSNAPGNDGVNPALDPARTFHDDAFWMKLEHNGQIVGVVGERFVDCNGCGYYEAVRDGRLFGQDPKPPLDVLTSAAGETGRCSFGGGIWVHPDHRGAGLSWYLANLGRAIAIRIWNLNAAYGMVFEPLRKNGMVATNYGGHRTVKMLEGYFPLHGSEAIVWSVEFDVLPLFERMRDTILDITHGPDKQMRDLAPRTAGKRKN